MKTCRLGHEYSKEKDRCPICKAAYMKQWQNQNREKVRQKNREWYARNSDSVIERTNKYRSENKELYREYYHNSKGDGSYHRARANKRRAIMVEAFVEVIEELVVFDRDNWICQLCLNPVDKSLAYPNDPQEMRASLDHVVPLANGGKHAYENVQCSHLSCNKGKSNRA